MSGPLDGITVIDLTRALAGPHAGMMLADLGARVIKVENPGTGDDTRGWGPPFVGPEDDPQATYFLSCNRNKESIALDLKSDDGRSVLRELLGTRRRRCIENFRPGVLDRLGFSAERMHELNPAPGGPVHHRLRPRRPRGGRRSGYDQILQGEAGLMSLTGSGPDDPQRVGRAHRRPALRHVRRVRRRSRRCCSASGPARARSSAPRCSPPSIGVHAFQGTRCHRRRRGAAGPGQPPPLHRPLRPVPLPATGSVQISVGSERPVADVRLRVRDRRRRGRSSPPTRSGSRNREKVIDEVERRVRRPYAAELLPELARGRHPGRRGPHPGRGLRVGADPLPGPGDRRRPPGPRHGSSLPGPPLRFDDTAHAGGRTEHLPPPALGEHDGVGPRLAATRWTPAAGEGPGREQQTAGVGRPRAASTPCSTRAASRAGTLPRCGGRARQPLRRRSWRRPRDKAGVDESVLTGEGTLHGRRVAVVVSEFRFLAGSIGLAAAERLVNAVERATREGLPLLAGPASGGTRMQEGTIAFLPMVKITRRRRGAQAGRPALPRLPAPPHHRRRDGLLGLARPRHRGRAGRAARLPRAAGLRGAVRHAVPGGRAGRREPLRARAGRRGAAVEALAEVAARALNVLWHRARGCRSVPELPRESLPDLQAWESITRSRRPERPGVRALLSSAPPTSCPLNGTGQGEKDPGLLLALARFGGALRGARPGPAGTRRMDAPARPGRRCARPGAACGWPTSSGCRWSRVIDTAGAALSKEAEEGGLAGEIARCLADLVDARRAHGVRAARPGRRRRGAGPAARRPGHRAQHAWLSPLPPEGASAILYRDTDHAPEIAASQGVRSADLLRDGVVDRIVAEHPDAADEPADFCARMAAGARARARAAAAGRPGDPRGPARLARYRALG